MSDASPPSSPSEEPAQFPLGSSCSTSESLSINPARDLAEAISVSVETGTRVDVSVPGIADVQVDTRTRVDVVVPLFGKLKNAVRAWWARGRDVNG